jgi:hypothetical protein
MASKEQILAFLDKVIASLKTLAPIIPGKIDDLAASFLEWGRNDPTFLEWLERFTPPAPGAFTAPPEELVDALRRWNTETGAKASTTGSWMELIQLVLQIAAWWKARQPAPAPAG